MHGAIYLCYIGLDFIPNQTYSLLMLHETKTYLLQSVPRFPGKKNLNMSSNLVSALSVLQVNVKNRDIESPKRKGSRFFFLGNIYTEYFNKTKGQFSFSLPVTSGLHFVGFHFQKSWGRGNHL